MGQFEYLTFFCINICMQIILDKLRIKLNFLAIDPT